MQLTIRIPLVAKDKEGNLHGVAEIRMGQSATYVALIDTPLLQNSVDYDFFIDGRRVNIYKSALFNPYIEYMPYENLICFEEETVAETKIDRIKAKNENIPF